MASGRAELIDRLSEATGQLVTSVFNSDLAPEQQIALAAALEQGARLEMVTRLNPFELEIRVVTPNGGSVSLAKYLER